MLVTSDRISRMNDAIGNRYRLAEHPEVGHWPQ
jgi:hypothetical protein